MLINVGPKKGQLVADLIAERKPSVMVELGAYIGYSAIKFGDAVRRAGGKKYLSFELNPVNAAVSKVLIELAGLQDFVQVVIAPSHLSIAGLVQDSVVDYLEFFFVDHWKDRYVPDIWLVERLGLLRAGKSVVVADNVSRSRSTEYAEWVQASPAEKRAILDRHSFKDSWDGVNLVKSIREKGLKDIGLDLENVPGKPDFEYETTIHEFEGSGGRQVSSSCSIDTRGLANGNCRMGLRFHLCSQWNRISRTSSPEMVSCAELPWILFTCIYLEIDFSIQSLHWNLNKVCTS